jgi:hypothetical protein
MEAEMTTPGQAPVASVAEAAERSHFALRRAVVDVATGLLHAGVLSHSGHADLSARVGPDTVLIATLNRTRDFVPDDLAVVRLDGSVAEGDLGITRGRPSPGTRLRPAGGTEAFSPERKRTGAPAAGERRPSAAGARRAVSW